MRQVLLEKPKAIVVRETSPPPAPGDNEAVVRLRQAGICGSDLAAYRGSSPLVTYPRVLGHELVVDIEAAPARPEWVGKRAVIEPMVPCRSCRACRQARYNCCVDLKVMGVHIDGGMSERFRVDLDRVHLVPEGMSDEVAVLAEPTSIAYRAVQRADIQAGQAGVVFGAGTIGLLIAALLLRARGCQAIVIDLDPWRLEQAEKLGATPVASGDPKRVLAEVEALTDGNLADVVFEATGSSACTLMTTDLMAPTGRIVLVGWNRGPVEVDTVALMRKEGEILGSRNSANAFGPVLRLLQAGAVDASLFVTHRVGMDGVADALAMLDAGAEPALKTLVHNRS